MAKGIQTSNGKAFEYACLLGLYNELSPIQKIETKDSPQLRTAQALYEGLDAKMQDALDKAANAAVRVIRRLEPQLWEPDGNEPLYLSHPTGIPQESGRGCKRCFVFKKTERLANWIFL